MVDFIQFLHEEIKRMTRDVRTPCEVVKSWFNVEPEIFKITPDKFYTITLNRTVQHCELNV